MWFGASKIKRRFQNVIFALKPAPLLWFSVSLNFWKCGERCSIVKLGEYRCVLGIDLYSVRSAFQAQCGSEIALITSQKMDWQLLTPETFIYLQNRYRARTRQNYLLSLLRNLFCIYLLPVGKSFLNSHLESCCWDGKGIYFILSVQWSHQENFSCGADTSQSELCFWIEISNSVTHCERNQAGLRLEHFSTQIRF